MTETAAPLFSAISSDKTAVSKAIDPSHVLKVVDFIKATTYHDPSVDNFISHDSFSDLFQHHMKAISVERGHILCSVIVTPALANYFNGLHGGSVASIAERISLACVKTVVPEDKQLFVGELCMSYLSAAPISSELVVEGSVVRSGRNLSVVNIVFKIKDTSKVTYQAHSTVYHALISKI